VGRKAGPALPSPLTSAALRGAGAPGMALNLIVLLYVCTRFGMELAGNAGAAAIVGAFLPVEAFLFRATRSAP
jgi:hypothetical protein